MLLFDGEVESKEAMGRYSPVAAEMLWSRSPVCPVSRLCWFVYFQYAQQGACKICSPSDRGPESSGHLSPSTVLGISLGCSNSKEAFTLKASKVILLYRFYIE